ncbi:hypothetical protein MML48_9g00014462 [Holotrichia oblita]|uniref:Uncharacterized protein n=1 Tax=Holotrichia oblita TaxID=644536 RepID=A0ACB9SKH5_HOLOL|nr:hypothetical protein MML48_9g00014462 [Holotrichia oblita]
MNSPTHTHARWVPGLFYVHHYAPPGFKLDALRPEAESKAVVRYSLYYFLFSLNFMQDRHISIRFRAVPKKPRNRPSDGVKPKRGIASNEQITNIETEEQLEAYVNTCEENLVSDHIDEHVLDVSDMDDQNTIGANSPSSEVPIDPQPSTSSTQTLTDLQPITSSSQACPPISDTERAGYTLAMDFLSLLPIFRVDSDIFLVDGEDGIPGSDGECSKGDKEKELEKRLKKGSKAGMFSKMLKSKNISKVAKLGVYQTVLRPTVTYACETWTLTKKEETKLEVWERKVLRRIFGGIRVGDEYRRRTNKDIEELYKKPNIVQVVKAQRARWLGHIARMSDQRWVKRILTVAAGGKRRRDRPR